MKQCVAITGILLVVSTGAWATDAATLVAPELNFDSAVAFAEDARAGLPG